jgi:hypothetical protein
VADPDRNPFTACVEGIFVGHIVPDEDPAGTVAGEFLRNPIHRAAFVPRHVGTKFDDTLAAVHPQPTGSDRPRSDTGHARLEGRDGLFADPAVVHGEREPLGLEPGAVDAGGQHAEILHERLHDRLARRRRRLLKNEPVALDLQSMVSGVGDFRDADTTTNIGQPASAHDGDMDARWLVDGGEYSASEVVEHAVVRIVANGYERAVEVGA